jgi:inhibitor of cysteine peptidase
MRHRFQTLTLALATSALVALTASARTFDGKTVTLTDGELKKADLKVELAKGDKLVVSVASNKTTGFGWFVASKESEALKSAGKPEYLPPEKGKAGAGGTEVFTFTAEAAGEVEVELHYKRPFEKDKEPAKKYTFKVVIK